ncbi:MAG: SRPBCC domain-containing protein [Polyangiales bacterium]
MTCIARTYLASVEEVFNSWLDPQVMHRWMFVTPTSEIVEIDLHPHTGGAFSIIERCASRDINHRGVFGTVVKPQHLTLRLEAECPIEVEVSRARTGSTLTLSYTGDPLANWRAMLDRLDAVLRGLA